MEGESYCFPLNLFKVDFWQIFIEIKFFLFLISQFDGADIFLSKYIASNVFCIKGKKFQL